VAKHYRWSLALRPHDDKALASPALAEFDAVISPTIRVSQPASSGVDVGDTLWQGGSLPALDQGQFYFVEIPAEQQPEFVLESLFRLRT